MPGPTRRTRSTTTTPLPTPRSSTSWTTGARSSAAPLPTACGRPGSPTGGTARRCTWPRPTKPRSRTSWTSSRATDATLTLDTDQDQVAYDLSDWDDDRLTALVDELDAAGIAQGWDEDELFVYAADEQAADELLERVAHPHELPAESDDGPAGAELLGEVFVAADRLQHDPDDHEGTVSMLGLGHAVEGADPPYGLGSKEWDHLRGRVGALCSQLRASKVDEDAVIDDGPRPPQRLALLRVRSPPGGGGPNLVSQPLVARRNAR